jgi:hypothetical protein
MQTEEQVKCSNCGYDMRGLGSGILCPECGGETRKRVYGGDDSDGKVMQFINANVAVKGLAPVPDIRKRIKFWMKLGGVLVSVFFLLQLLVTFALIPIGMYRLVLFVLSLLWPLVVVEMMTSKVNASMPPMYTWIQKYAPYTQWCWAIGYGLWLVFHVPRTGFTLGGNLRFFYPILILHAVAGIGLAGISFWLHDLALRLGLDCAAKRCNVFAIAIFTLGILVFVLPWKHIAAANLGVAGFIFTGYILALMIPWLWCVSLFARALLEFSADASWSLRYDDNLEGRQERIRQKQENHEHTRWF